MRTVIILLKYTMQLFLFLNSFWDNEIIIISTIMKIFVNYFKRI